MLFRNQMDNSKCLPLSIINLDLGNLVSQTQPSMLFNFARQEEHLLGKHW